MTSIDQMKNTLKRGVQRKKDDQARNGIGVSKTIRTLLPFILECKETLSWTEIADILAGDGLKWKTGKPITGSDLRAAVYRIQHSGTTQNVAPIPTSTNTSLSAHSTSIPSSTISTNIPKPANQPTSKVSRIREEMRRSNSERKK